MNFTVLLSKLVSKAICSTTLLVQEVFINIWMFFNSFLPQQFQNFILNLNLEVAYGAVIRLKNNVLEGQYLHSHRQLYPVGARQQQITTVYIRDPNNRWFIKRHNQSTPLWNATDPIDFVRNGDLVRIEHRTTGRNIHVHRGPAPISNKMYQVTGFGVVSAWFHCIHSWILYPS